MNLTDPDRFTWLLVTLATCSFGAGILSLLVPKATQNVDPPKVKCEDEEKEMGVKINQAYVQENVDTQSV